MEKRYERRNVLTKAQAAPRPPDRTLLLAAAASVPLLAARLLAPAVMPIIGIVSIGTAAITALLAWYLRSEQDSTGLSLWDVSGGWALIGIAAGILGDADRIVEAVVAVGG